LMATHAKFVSDEARLAELISVIDCPVIHCRFEALAADPKAEAARIAGELGLEVPDGYLEAAPAMKATRSELHDTLADELMVALGQSA